MFDVQRMSKPFLLTSSDVFNKSTFSTVFQDIVMYGCF